MVFFSPLSICLRGCLWWISNPTYDTYKTEYKLCRQQQQTATPPASCKRDDKVHLKKLHNMKREKTVTFKVSNTVRVLYKYNILTELNVC